MARIVSVLLVLLTVVLAPSLQAKAKPQSVLVNCGLGGSLASAIATIADALKIEFVGTCNANLVISRGNLTIRGLDSTAVIQGSLTFDRTVPSSDALPDGPVTLESFSILSSPANGLTVGPDSHVTARDVTVANSAKDGIQVYGGGWLRCIDCQSTSNAAHGMEVVANGSAELAGNCSFSNNTVFGIFVASSGEVSFYDRDAASPVATANILANANGSDGIDVSDGGSILSAESTTISASGNGIVTQGGSGLLVGTGAAGILAGTVNVDGNALGIAVLAGKLLLFANVNATNNTLAGLHSSDDGTLRLIGAANTLSNNGLGANVDASFLRLTNTTFSGNRTDLRLVFGAKARLAGSAPTSVSCDGTQLLSGAACPP